MHHLSLALSQVLITDLYASLPISSHNRNLSQPVRPYQSVPLPPNLFLDSPFPPHASWTCSPPCSSLNMSTIFSLYGLLPAIFLPLSSCGLLPSGILSNLHLDRGLPWPFCLSSIPPPPTHTAAFCPSLSALFFTKHLSQPPVCVTFFFFFFSPLLEFNFLKGGDLLCFLF